MGLRIPAGGGSFPSTEWFNGPVDKSAGLAPVPGTADADAMSINGRLHIPRTGELEAIHLHGFEDGTSGSFDLEVFRWRSGVFTLIATVSQAAGAGDFYFANFTFVSEALRQVERGDYLLMQATDRQTGLGTPRGFVDVHFAKAPLAR